MKPKNPNLKTTRRPAVALVLRHAALLPEAARTALQFHAAAQRVDLYLLEPAAIALTIADDPTLEALKPMVRCCCNHRPSAIRLGLAYSDVATMAKGLDVAKWVLTF